MCMCNSGFSFRCVDREVLRGHVLYSPLFLFVLHKYGMWIVARLLVAHFLQKLLVFPLYTKAYDAVIAL